MPGIDVFYFPYCLYIFGTKTELVLEGMVTDYHNYDFYKALKHRRSITSLNIVWMFNKKQGTFLFFDY